ncbi:helix-turn-helix domain-containing protein [Aeromonas sp. 23P]|uniref:helix-turn-helix domain-containing protein n=1 Tax=Aeromonas sp. 23P TaxID=3452716 RepID=UPI003F7B2922|nr:helix-turn-helix transcriptional regulator [Aeromonas veronii]
MTIKREDQAIDFDLIHSMGIRIRMIREAFSQSRHAFAKATNIESASLTNYELGFRKCNLSTVLKLRWIPQYEKFAKALLLDTPIIKLNHKTKKYTFDTPDLGGEPMTRSEVAKLLLDKVVAVCKEEDVELPGYYLDRWTDNKG